MTKPIFIDGKLIEVEPGTTILQACEMAGAEIPRFCYHERLSIAGNCRMCLVEVEGIPKPIASCAMGVTDLPPNKDGAPRSVLTASPLVKAAREGVMEFLLINHPLDCPICDQGGECDLQDQAMAFGCGGSRFGENKRAVEEKYIGPLIKTFMNRCIHCTRCVRFMTEVAGVEELGAISRGEDMEITTYLDRGILSELSGNVNDLCPVGALTHRPWSYIARPWEMEKTESFDVMDALGSAIRVDSRGPSVMRVLPRNNDDVNEEWITDKTRYACDGLRTQRLDHPYVRDANGKLRPASWDEALAVVADKLSSTVPERIGVIAGDLCSAEEMYALKDLADRIGIASIDCRQDGAKLDPSLGRASYLFNSTIAGIDQADAILLVGANPRVEAAVLNARILTRWRQGGLTVGVIGEPTQLTYGYEHLGVGPQTLGDILAGKHAFAEVLKNAQRPMVIVGSGVAARADGQALLAQAAKLAAASVADKDVGDWNAFNVLHTAASRVAGLDLGLVPGKGGLDAAGMIAAANSGKLDVLYVLSADEIELPAKGKSFVVYQGHHGDRGAHRADVILPGAAYTEKSGTYVNTEGRAQLAVRCVFPPGDAKEDWAILRALSAKVGKTLPYDTLDALRSEMYKAAPLLARLNTVAPAPLAGIEALAKKNGAVDAEAFASPIRDFYLTNPIARASAVMAEMSALKKTLEAPHRLKAAE
ncbi:NADH-quinone oxidoreductase subunit NuoG [Hyphomicrobium sulfonivorans]|uniref:NADH-quinone oxidoreductase n=1 Tax=Hyphomicrobium sulfonivorans TaxID=121290 RepID=A0A120CWZ6_HYPSL|nr:NADH-quinone oxidoreductase subunit NuoG [Hyphomicrobium sulfonivorans]KWT70167.1 NADH-ubiquinone oxidoreductase chain G [Hyphomicrobium sulfonivorans]MBI1650762.1 NADH-quinone oxidoreductase subunit G [Hyphomicrobium sulfonivorans]NSL71880.1 NADH-quinone oxidoreductase subunit G [Hyphomicrobium sulfonivorans]